LEYRLAGRARARQLPLAGDGDLPAVGVPIVRLRRAADVAVALQPTQHRIHRLRGDHRVPRQHRAGRAGLVLECEQRRHVRHRQVHALPAQHAIELLAQRGTQALELVADLVLGVAHERRRGAALHASFHNPTHLHARFPPESTS
jgi:hypothetical protein